MADCLQQAGRYISIGRKQRLHYSTRSGVEILGGVRTFQLAWHVYFPEICCKHTGLSRIAASNSRSMPEGQCLVLRLLASSE